MTAGHLAEKSGYYYIVLSYTKDSKRKTKWISTKLPTKGNKKRAEEMLLHARMHFDNSTERVLEQDASSGIILINDNMKTINDPNNPQLADHMLEWLDMVRPSVELSTFASYSQIVHNKIVPYFRDHPVTLVELLPMHLERYYSYCLQSVSGNTVRHYHACIRAALNWAVRRGQMGGNVALSAAVPKGMPFAASYYAVDEMEYLLQHVLQHDFLAIPVFAGGMYGFRRSEAMGMKASNLDFESNLFVVRHTVLTVNVDHHQILVQKDRPKSKASVRSVKLMADFRELTLAKEDDIRISRKKAGSMYDTRYLDYLNVDQSGKLINPERITRNFGRYCKKIGLRQIRYHDLRHSCASILLSRGVNMKEIQAWLGHSSYNTTANLYAHLDPNTNNRVADVMASTFHLDNKKALNAPTGLCSRAS